MAAVARALATAEGVTLGAFLSEQIRSTWSSERRAGMIAAHSAKEDGAVGALSEQVDSPDADVRRRALSDIEYATPDEALRDRVYAIARFDEVEQVRNEAAFLLGVWGDARARGMLLGMIDHADAEVAATAVSAIRFVADDFVADRMAALRHHSDVDVRVNAALVLEVCGSTQFIESVAAMLDSPDPHERGAGIVMLTSLHPDDIPRDLLLRHEDDPELRLYLLAGRISLGDTDAMQEVLDMLHSWDAIPDELRSGTVGCLLEMPYALADDVPAASIAALLDHDDAWVRGAAVGLAGQQRGRSFIAQLKSLEGDESPTMLDMSVGQEARMALDRIAGRRPPMVPFYHARLRTHGINGEAPSEKASSKACDRYQGSPAKGPDGRTP
jgi:HEAT repeat protein